jgi:DNA excision repair protein ERCC-4
MISTLGIPDVRSGLTHWWATEQNAQSIFQQQPPSSSNTSQQSTSSQYAKRLDSQNIFIELHNKRHSNRAYDILHEVEPSFIIMYDANPTLTRQLELYATARPNKTIRVYFLVYEGSMEERTYLDDIKQERSAFQKLIEHKSLMTGTDSIFTRNIPVNPISNNTRQGGGNNNRPTTTQLSSNAVRKEQADPPPPSAHRRCVVVDTREFRSVLPLMLYREGIEIVPMTLTVGDYILTPNICVERKSIPDLFSSLKSGRLYKQAEQMCTHFEQPMLLIEFDENRSFRLVDELSRDVSQHSIVSKLVLVLLHFPALHFLWMSCPRASASLFSQLKENHDEPEDHISAASNLSSNSFDSTEGTAAHLSNQDSLKRIPGMTAGNVHKVISKVKTLGELSRLSLTSLQNLMGKIGGKKAYDFFNLNGIGQI